MSFKDWDKSSKWIVGVFVGGVLLFVLITAAVAIF